MTDKPEFTFELMPNPNRMYFMRDQYLDSLPYSQEYYLELQIERARLYLITRDQQQAGYFYLSEDGWLLEYFLAPEWINRVDSLFGVILKEFSVKKALCKSFDATLLSCCYAFHNASKAIGILFRDYVEKPSIQPPNALSIRNAVPADEAAIIAVNEEVFDYPSEVMPYIQANQIFLYEKAGELVGFGIHSPVYPGRPNRDIGMLIVPAFRGQGYGQYIIQHLVHFCQENNWKPSAGCAIENIASRKCLEKSGFIARHRLLKFSF